MATPAAPTKFKVNSKAVAGWGLGIACVALVFGVVSFAYIASTYKTAKDVADTTKTVIKTSAHALTKVDDLERMVSGVVSKLRQAPPMPQVQPPQSQQMMQSVPLDYPPPPPRAPAHNMQAGPVSPMMQAGPVSPMMQAGPVSPIAYENQQTFGAAPSNFGWSGGRNPDESFFD